MIEGEFLLALQAAMEDHDKYGHIDSGDWEENGAMRVIGISRSDSVKLAKILLDSYGEDLRTGWTCPVCGALRDAEGKCPDGHKFDEQTAEGGRFATLLAIIEMVLSVGVHLERARWQSETPA